jgi:8-oxo-dGTP pyrophosphatase MutT (NUDIX family)
MRPDPAQTPGGSAGGLPTRDFAALAARRLLPVAPAAGEGQKNEGLDREGGDHRLDDARPFIVDPENIRPAAVLVPIIAHEDATLLLTERSHALAVHAGQIAFPGGRIEEGETPLEAALREAREEIGLAADLVSPIGSLSAYLTGTGFRVTPIVALVDPGYRLSLNTFEVAEAFEVPLSFLMNPGNHEVRTRELRGRTRRFYAMPWEGREIWGATAGMIRALYERVYGI